MLDQAVVARNQTEERVRWPAETSRGTEVGGRGRERIEETTAARNPACHPRHRFAEQLNYPSC